MISLRISRNMYEYVHCLRFSLPVCSLVFATWNTDDQPSRRCVRNLPLKHTKAKLIVLHKNNYTRARKHNGITTRGQDTRVNRLTLTGGSYFRVKWEKKEEKNGRYFPRRLYSQKHRNNVSTATEYTWKNVADIHHEPTATTVMGSHV